MNRLKEVRKYLKLTQQQLADEIGEKWHKIKDVETNKNKLSVDIADKLREKYSISFDWLLTGKGEMCLTEPTTPSNTLNNSVLIQGTTNGNININTEKFNHKEDIKEIIELLEYAPAGFLTIIKSKLQAFKDMSHF